MAAPRHQWKLRHSGPLRPALVALAAGCLLLARAAPAGGTEQVVVDRISGLAISGYDPVAYFTEGMATPGRRDLEYTFAGAVWRFRSEGNRSAFIADPDVYMPRFGGYDPTGIARGVAVPGDPRLWLAVGDRLYLFYSAEGRLAFSATAESVIATADRRWPSVQLTLSP